MISQHLKGKAGCRSVGPGAFAQVRLSCTAWLLNSHPELSVERLSDTWNWNTTLLPLSHLILHNIIILHTFAIFAYILPWDALPIFMSHSELEIFRTYDRSC